VIVAVGIDLVELARVRRAWGTHGERFLRRCFTDAEAAAARGRSDPVPALAARFAAKEAFQKTWPETLSWRDVGVVNAADGAPRLAFSERVARRMASEGWRAHVSLTHAREHAAAVVVLERAPG
jgi:holo-[acyl-carrier protein] synthase